MDDQQWLTERFQQHRPHLRAVASRMLGSLADATTPSRTPGSASAAHGPTRSATSRRGWPRSSPGQPARSRCSRPLGEWSGRADWCASGDRV